MSVAYFSPQARVVLSGSNLGAVGTTPAAGTDMTVVTDGAGAALVGTGLVVLIALTEVEMVG